MKIINMVAAAGLGLFSSVLMSAPDLTGKTPLEAGTALALHAEAVHGGWKSSKSEGRMVLRDAQGSENTQKLKTWLLESKDSKDGGRSFIVYDDKGTALLTHMNRTKDDLQWVWIPGLKRKMRIKAANVTGAFIGSEFAIEDLRSQYPEKYKITLLREENFEGEPCWLLERIPVVAETGYSKQLVWMDKQEFRVLNTEFYDRKGDLLKSMVTSDWQKYDDKFWRPNRTSMLNHQTNRSSEMIMDDIELGGRLRSSDFEAGRGLMREAR